MNYIMVKIIRKIKLATGLIIFQLLSVKRKMVSEPRSKLKNKVERFLKRKICNIRNNIDKDDNNLSQFDTQYWWNSD